MEAVNTYRVFDWLWTSGQLSAADVSALPGIGIEAVINLAVPSSSYALPGEAELVTGLGLTYIHLPVAWENPLPQQFFQFVGLLQALQGRKVWLHCALNMRVSAFVYLYRRLVLGEKETDASFPMREIWAPNETWQEFMQQVSRQFPPP